MNKISRARLFEGKVEAPNGPLMRCKTVDAAVEQPLSGC